MVERPASAGLFLFGGVSFQPLMQFVGCMVFVVTIFAVVALVVALRASSQASAATKAR